MEFSALPLRTKPTVYQRACLLQTAQLVAHRDRQVPVRLISVGRRYTPVTDVYITVMSGREDMQRANWMTDIQRSGVV